MLVLLAGIIPGCVTVPPQDVSLTGAYVFPNATDLHHPVLVLTEQGRFAFVTDADDQSDPESWANHGRFTRAGNTLTLSYEAAECCQYMDFDEEALVVVRRDGTTVIVEFRGEEVRLVPASD